MSYFVLLKFCAPDYKHLFMTTNLITTDCRYRGYASTKVYRFLPFFTATAKLGHLDLLPLSDYLRFASLEICQNMPTRYKKYFPA